MLSRMAWPVGFPDWRWWGLGSGVSGVSGDWWPGLVCLWVRDRLWTTAEKGWWELEWDVVVWSLSGKEFDGFVVFGGIWIEVALWTAVLVVTVRHCYGLGIARSLVMMQARGHA